MYAGNPVSNNPHLITASLHFDYVHPTTTVVQNVSSQFMQSSVPPSVWQQQSVHKAQKAGTKQDPLPQGISFLTCLPVPQITPGVQGGLKHCAGTLLSLVGTA